MIMTHIDPFLYYASLALIITITTACVALSESWISKAALYALHVQPSARNDITRIAIFGTALTETSAIVGLVMSFILIAAQGSLSVTGCAGLTSLGIVAALGLTGSISALISARPTTQACYAIARQPFFASKILNLTLITASFIQTPVIFGFIISLLIFYQIPSAITIPESIRLIAAGLSIGIGCLGPTLGLGHFAQNVCKGIGTNRDAYNRLLTFTFVSQALIETPIILALVISFILVRPLAVGYTSLQALAALSAAFCVGIGTFAPGLSSGQMAARASSIIAQRPFTYSSLSRASVIGQALIDAVAVYAWLVALMIILLSA